MEKGGFARGIPHVPSSNLEYLDPWSTRELFRLVSAVEAFSKSIRPSSREGVWKLIADAMWKCRFVKSCDYNRYRASICAKKYDGLIRNMAKEEMRLPLQYETDIHSRIKRRLMKRFKDEYEDKIQREKLSSLRDQELMEAAFKTYEKMCSSQNRNNNSSGGLALFDRNCEVNINAKEKQYFGKVDPLNKDIPGIFKLILDQATEISAPELDNLLKNLRIPLTNSYGPISPDSGYSGSLSDSPINYNHGENLMESNLSETVVAATDCSLTENSEEIEVVENNMVKTNWAANSWVVSNLETNNCAGSNLSENSSEDFYLLESKSSSDMNFTENYPVQHNTTDLNFAKEQFALKNGSKYSWREANMTVDDSPMSYLPINILPANDFSINNPPLNNLPMNNFPSYSRYPKNFIALNNWTSSAECNLVSNNWEKQTFSVNKQLESNLIEVTYLENNFAAKNLGEKTVNESKLEERSLIEVNWAESSLDEINLVENNLIENNLVEHNLVENTLVENNLVENNFKNNFLETNFEENKLDINSYQENNSLENTYLENNSLENHYLENNYLQLSSFENNSLENSSLKNSSLENNHLENNSIGHNLVDMNFSRYNSMPNNMVPNIANNPIGNNFMNSSQSKLENETFTGSPRCWKCLLKMTQEKFGPRFSPYDFLRMPSFANTHSFYPYPGYQNQMQSPPKYMNLHNPNHSQTIPTSLLLRDPNLAISSEETYKNS